MSLKGRLILFASSIHTGGGLVLLKAILNADELPRIVAFVDARALNFLKIPQQAEVVVVNPNVFDRFKAQWALHNVVKSDDILLCLQGVPPFFKSRGKVVVFQQNRLALGQYSLAGYPLKSRIQVIINRWIGRLLKDRVKTWFVQTPSMQRDLEAWYGKPQNVRVLPFADTSVNITVDKDATPLWDFVFVADGLPHKNHKNLLRAWHLLASDGIRPSLALTLGSRDVFLARILSEFAQNHGLRIQNLGHLEHQEVLALYKRSRALIYPSTMESFGLPLIEAATCGLPIIAPELDYVREVCEPVETFDANSPMSIARAVRRFLGYRGPSIQMHSATEFIREVCQ